MLYGLVTRTLLQGSYRWKWNTIISFQARISILYKSKTQLKFNPYIGLNNVTVNVCKFMNGNGNNNIVDMMLEILKKYGNIIQPCPMKVSQ